MWSCEKRHWEAHGKPPHGIFKRPRPLECRVQRQMLAALPGSRAPIDHARPKSKRRALARLIPTRGLANSLGASQELASRNRWWRMGKLAMRRGLTLRGDYDAARLRGVARRTKSAVQGRRLLALAEEIYDGSRTKAACVGGSLASDRQDLASRRCRDVPGWAEGLQRARRLTARALGFRAGLTCG